MGVGGFTETEAFMEGGELGDDMLLAGATRLTCARSSAGAGKFSCFGGLANAEMFVDSRKFSTGVSMDAGSFSEAGRSVANGDFVDAGKLCGGRLAGFGAVLSLDRFAGSIEFAVTGRIPDSEIFSGCMLVVSSFSDASRFVVLVLSFVTGRLGAGFGRVTSAGEFSLSGMNCTCMFTDAGSFSDNNRFVVVGMFVTAGSLGADRLVGIGIFVGIG